MGGVRGDEIELGLIRAAIMEMGDRRRRSRIIAVPTIHVVQEPPGAGG